MLQIRRGVFESNSSSCHSITFSRKGLEENEMLIKDDGYIHTVFGEFGWEIEDYCYQGDKLSYLLTMTAHLNDCYPYCWKREDQKEMIKKFIETDDFKRISDEIASYADCNGIVLDYSEGYIDHQSIDNDTLDEFLECNNTNIIDFVFGNVIVHTDNDNH